MARVPLAKMHNTQRARAILADARDLLGGDGMVLGYYVARHLCDMSDRNLRGLRHGAGAAFCCTSPVARFSSCSLHQFAKGPPPQLNGSRSGGSEGGQFRASCPRSWPVGERAGGGRPSEDTQRKEPAMETAHRWTDCTSSISAAGSQGLQQPLCSGTPAGRRQGGTVGRRERIPRLSSQLFPLRQSAQPVRAEHYQN
jgi:hypothetical protein